MTLHSCPDCGLTHGQADELADVAPAVEAAPVVEAGPNEHDVAIAEIQAEAEVATAKIYAATGDEELRLENERLRGELAGMRQGLEAGADAAAAAADTPPAGPPVVVEAPPADPGPAVPPPPPASEQPTTAAPKKDKTRTNYFGF